MSSIFKALSSPFRIDSRGTNENAYSSYGQDEKLEFYILFSLNGFLGREKSGSPCYHLILSDVFSYVYGWNRKDCHFLLILTRWAISILSRYYKASSSAQKTGKMMGFAARMIARLLIFTSKRGYGLKRQRNLLIQERSAKSWQ